MHKTIKFFKQHLPNHVISLAKTCRETTGKMETYNSLNHSIWISMMVKHQADILKFFKQPILPNHMSS